MTTYPQKKQFLDFMAKMFSADTRTFEIKIKD